MAESNEVLSGKIDDLHRSMNRLSKTFEDYVNQQQNTGGAPVVSLCNFMFLLYYLLRFESFFNAVTMNMSSNVWTSLIYILYRQ